MAQQGAPGGTPGRLAPPVIGAPLLQVRDVNLSFGGVRALKGLTFDVYEGHICALIGPNGAGKTSMFNCLSRLYKPSSGEIVFGGRDLLSSPPHRIAKLGVARTFQNLALFPAMSVLDNVMTGAHTHTVGNYATAAVRSPGVFKGERDARGRALNILQRLELAHLAGRPPSGLPLGTLKRIELARALAAEPRLLMLDEPAAGLTHSEVDELAGVIRRVRDDFRLTILLVEHHMAMVMSISDNVVVMDFGEKIAEGIPAEVCRDPRVIEAYLGREAP